MLFCPTVSLNFDRIFVNLIFVDKSKNPLIFSSNIAGFTNFSNTTGSTNSSFNNTIIHLFQNKTVCDCQPRYLHWYHNVYNPFDIITWGLMAPCMVLICNLIIIIYMRKQSPIVNSNEALKRKIDKKVTQMLIVTSLFFTLCILPSSIYLMLLHLLYNNVADALDRDNPVFQIVSCLLLSNHAFNVFLYLGGKKFREDGKLAFRLVVSKCIKILPGATSMPVYLESISCSTGSIQYSQ